MPISRDDAKRKHGPSEVDKSLERANQQLRETNQKLREKAGDDEYLIKQMGNVISKMGELPEIRQAPRLAPKKKAHSRPLVAMAFVADPHMEEVVDPAETEGLACWNFNMFLRSSWYLTEKIMSIVNIMRSSHEITELKLNFMGDMVTGEIHPDVYFTNAFYLPDALTAGPWYWSQVVRELSAHFDKLTCTCVPGNHGRMDHKPTSKRCVGRNWDTAMYQNTATLAHKLSNVEWCIPRSPKKVICANDWYFLLQHGDRVPQHGATTPYYGMQRQRSADISKRLGFRVRDVGQRLEDELLFDFDVRGHHHINGTVDERTILCPSMMGNNEFGLDNTFSNKIPGARIFFVDKEHGIAGDWRLNLLDLPEEHKFEALPRFC